MKRLTIRNEDGSVTVERGASGRDIVNRLAELEDMLQGKRWVDADAVWEKLRKQKKHNSSIGVPFTINVGINQAIGIVNSSPSVSIEEV